MIAHPLRDGQQRFTRLWVLLLRREVCQRNSHMRELQDIGIWNEPRTPVEHRVAKQREAQD